jgi:hypothetical protein
MRQKVQISTDVGNDFVGVGAAEFRGTQRASEHFQAHPREGYVIMIWHCTADTKLATSGGRGQLWIDGWLAYKM